MALNFSIASLVGGKSKSGCDRSESTAISDDISQSGSAFKPKKRLGNSRKRLNTNQNNDDVQAKISAVENEGGQIANCGTSQHRPTLSPSHNGTSDLPSGIEQPLAQVGQYNQQTSPSHSENRPQSPAQSQTLAYAGNPLPSDDVINSPRPLVHSWHDVLLPHLHMASTNPFLMSGDGAPAMNNANKLIQAMVQQMQQTPSSCGTGGGHLPPGLLPPAPAAQPPSCPGAAGSSSQPTPASQAAMGVSRVPPAMWAQPWLEILQHAAAQRMGVSGSPGSSPPNPAHTTGCSSNAANGGTSAVPGTSSMLGPNGLHHHGHQHHMHHNFIAAAAAAGLFLGPYRGWALHAIQSNGILNIPKPKRVRTAFSPGQLLQLEAAFDKNHYVIGAERRHLAHRLALTETQVKVWFQNRRTKHKRMKTEQHGGTSGDAAHDDDGATSPNSPVEFDEDGTEGSEGNHTEPQGQAELSSTYPNQGCSSSSDISALPLHHNSAQMNLLNSFSWAMQQRT